MLGYDKSFYERRSQEQKSDIKLILVELLKMFPHIKSAVDIGCGPGGWLAAIEQLGIKEILGVDGPWVPQESLMIQPEMFVAHNLNESFPLLRRYDLAISLEFAEHLLQERADAFVNFLTNTSDIILFSAAIPMQGGTNHYNEQWPSYWANLFRQYGFIFVDLLRWKFWNYENIPVWYRQNIFIIVKQNMVSNNEQLLSYFANSSDVIFDVVHPEWYIIKRMYANSKISELEKNILSKKKENIDELSIKYLCRYILKKIYNKIRSWL